MRLQGEDQSVTGPLGVGSPTACPQVTPCYHLLQGWLLLALALRVTKNL